MYIFTILQKGIWFEFNWNEYDKDLVQIEVNFDKLNNTDLFLQCIGFI